MNHNPDLVVSQQLKQTTILKKKLFYLIHFMALASHVIKTSKMTSEYYAKPLTKVWCIQTSYF